MSAPNVVTQTRYANASGTETLAYIGPARRKAHGADGVRYRHEWPTGWHVVIFASHDEAAKYFAPKKVEVQP